VTPNFSSILKIMVPKRLKDQGLSKKNFFLGGSKRGKKSQKFKILGKKKHIFSNFGPIRPLKNPSKNFFLQIFENTWSSKHSG